LTAVAPLAARLSYIALIACRFFTGVAHVCYKKKLLRNYDYNPKVIKQKFMNNRVPFGHRCQLFGLPGLLQPKEAD